MFVGIALLTLFQCFRVCVGIPEQTEWQKELASRVQQSAAARSAEAEPVLLQRIGSKEFRRGLAACCPSLLRLDPSQLLQRLQAEIRVSEVVSGFPAVASPRDAFGWWNVDLHQNENSSFLQNQWQVRFSHHGNFSGGEGWFGVQDDAEVRIYGLRPFSKRGVPSSSAETSERGVYCVVNALRVDSGSPLYGSISAVFFPERMREVALISAVDTGSFEGLCNSTDGSLSGIEQPTDRMTNPLRHNCSAFPWGPEHLGTMEHFNHLLLVNDNYWNTTAGRGTLLTLFARIVNEPEDQVDGWGGYAIRGPDLIHYFEAMPAGTMTFPHDVKFLIGKFPDLFGSSEGAELQHWCASQGWMLVWSLGLNVADRVGRDGLNFFSAPFLKGRFPSNHRLLDVSVLRRNAVTANVSITDSDVSNFYDVWAQAEKARVVANSTNTTVSDAQWSRLYGSLHRRLPESVLLEPLRAGSCADEERCIGTSRAGYCVCYGAGDGFVVV